MHALSAATEALYATFSGYSAEGMAYCPCGCIDPQEVQRLTAKPLRELHTEELRRYQFKAITTWGDIEHYKYFLPRILACYSQERDSTDLEGIHSKLVHANWETWPDAEREAILAYVLADWAAYINQQEVPEDMAFTIGAYALFLKPDDMVKDWELNKNTYSVKNLIHLFYYYGYKIFNGAFIAGDHLKAMLDDGLIAALESAFFEAADTDPAYAATVSAVLQMIEQEKALASRHP